MNKSLVFLIVSLFCISRIFAQTPLSGTFSSDTIISNSLSPYLISTTITVNNGSTFEVEPGTIIYFDNSISIVVDNATLKLNGALNDSIQLLNNGTQWARISGQYANINVSYCIFKNANQMISANYGEIRMNNSRCENVTGGDAVALHYCDSVIIHDCNFAGIKNTGKIDCIDADAIHYGSMYNNIFTNWNDDAIDIGTGAYNVNIYNNYAENCNYGISVGENSVVSASRNLMVDNYGGLQSHTGSILTAYNNTIYNSLFGIQCYHGGTSNTGGTAYVRNTIFSTNIFSYHTQASSYIEISYSCSDTDTLPGIGNVFGYPLFADTLNNNFHLSLGSNCINTGDPNDPLDTNGNFIDIGAFEYYDTSTVVSRVKHDLNICLYPNPTSDYCVIEGNKIISVDIFDVSGKFLNSIYNKSESDFLILNLSQLNSGLYYIRIKSIDGAKVEKLIIE